MKTLNYSQDDVLVIFTMDVEPVATADGKTSGPASAAEGARRVRQYADVIGEYGYQPTFFIHPEMAELQADLFNEMRERGAAVELHLHTVKFAHQGRKYPTELGGLPRPLQLEALAAARDRFTEAMGFTPALFRPGCFSANDNTYGVLQELGFAGGSISIPGRTWTKRYCAWAGAMPHPHFANNEFRQLPGNLSFVEIPLSVDRIGGLRTHPVLGFQHYVDLRPGGVYTEEEDSGRDHAVILHNMATQLITEKPLLKTIVIDVHNDRDFVTPGATPAKHLRTILDNLGQEFDPHNLHPVSATMPQTVEYFKALHPAS